LNKIFLFPSCLLSVNIQVAILAIQEKLYMNRKQFLQESSFAFAAVCMACASCTKEKQPQPEQTTDSVLFTINLGVNILNTGDSLLNKNVLVVRLAAANSVTSFTAVQRDCTHAGGFLDWNKSKERFVCPVHGSEFSATGAVLLGPAFNPLKQHKITIQNNTLTIYP
jgi:cytochrome b6-f complex iron-sulfur subunit